MAAALNVVGLMNVHGTKAPMATTIFTCWKSPCIQNCAVCQQRRLELLAKVAALSLSVAGDERS
jgi:biotin synthase-related radical SAM superfamily protein